MRFNDGRYLERAVAGEFSPGEFTCCLKDEKRPESTEEPTGSRSLTIAYLNLAGEATFLVHLYLRADGEIGGKKRPDPKWLVEEGVVYWAP